MAKNTEIYQEQLAYYSDRAVEELSKRDLLENIIMQLGWVRRECANAEGFAAIAKDNEGMDVLNTLQNHITAVQDYFIKKGEF